MTAGTVSARRARRAVYARQGVRVVAEAAAALGASFGDTLKQFVSGVSDAQDAAGELKDRFLRGEPVGNRLV